MADAQLSSRGGTPSSFVPMKRSLEDDHTPSVSSPLNPDAAARPRPKPAAREQREKKDSLKKRESTGSTRGSTPEKTAKKPKFLDTELGAASPARYNHPLPREPFHYSVRDPVFASHEPEPLVAPSGTELKKPIDHPENKKHYRYTSCVADPSFSYMRYYRATDDKPFAPRMSFADADRMMRFDESATILTNEKGWRMARANVCAREGSFYYEVKILRGVPPEGPASPPEHNAAQGPLPHVRVGWARREASLDVPVGFDGYSYGLTDIRLEPMHRSRMSKYLDDGSDKIQPKKSKSKLSKSKQTAAQGFTADDHAREGDVIGLEISLPSISLHRKVVDGTYNPAVDIDAGLDRPTAVASTNSLDAEDSSLNIVRDRFPVPYKGSMYFESMEYRTSKAMEAYGDRGPHSKESPSPNHADATVRSLPHSHIKVYKNGKKIGTAFRNLMAFLPPASQVGQEKERGVRTGLDDGMLGYFPAVSAFHGGMAEVNFGPNFWFPPPELASSVFVERDSADVTPDSTAAATAANTSTEPAVDGREDVQMTGVDEDGDREVDVAEAGVTTKAKAVEEAMMNGLDVSKGQLRGIGERYREQIAEDILADIIDEVDFFIQDGGEV